MRVPRVKSSQVLVKHLPGLDAFHSILVDVQTWPSESLSITRTFPPPCQGNRREECHQNYSTRVLLSVKTCLAGPAWHPLDRGVQAPTLSPLLALAPQPVGLCLYLVTLGGFASSTGIWHRRWKISLVRSPWKQAEPLRRFTLNGVHPACISCPMCLEFPPRPLEPLSRPGALLQRRPQAFALRVDADSLRIGLLSSPPSLPLSQSSLCRVLSAPSFNQVKSGTLGVLSIPRMQGTTAGLDWSGLLSCF